MIQHHDVALCISSYPCTNSRSSQGAYILGHDDERADFQKKNTRKAMQNGNGPGLEGYLCMTTDQTDTGDTVVCCLQNMTP